MTLVIQPINNELLLQQQKDFISEFLEFSPDTQAIIYQRYIKSKKEIK